MTGGSLSVRRFGMLLGLVLAAVFTFAAAGGTAQASFTFHRTVVVTANDLDNTSPNPSVVASDGLNKWFMYNDSNDTIDNTLGSFVTGPGTPLAGTGSVQFTLGANPLDRENIATYQFSGRALSSITTLSFDAYSTSGVAGPSESPYLNFNVDFNSSATWQKRLVYVPAANGPVPQDQWNTFDAINGGNALWTWSGYAANGNKWPDSNTAEYRTWSDILASFPGVRVLPGDGWFGVRVGEPGPTGYTGSIDSVTVGTSLLTTTFDFEPLAQPTIKVQKWVIGFHDDGHFALLIDNAVQAPDVQSGGHTDAISVTAGHHDVSEQAVAPTDLADYAGSVLCLATNQWRIRVVGFNAHAGTVGLDVQDGDKVVCTITNIRLPSHH